LIYVYQKVGENPIRIILTEKKTLKKILKSFNLAKQKYSTMMQLNCQVQTYAWGKPGSESTVAKLKRSKLLS
jgi:hypothetical protein